MDVIEKARAYAADKHADKKRKYTDQPYFNHLQAVVSTLQGASVMEPLILAAAYLHDTLVDHLPRIPGIQELFGRSVHVCPYCDGWEHRDAPIAVFGRGSKGAGLALLLRQWTEDLVLCSHGPADLAAEEQQLLDRRGIKVRESAITELRGEDGCLRALRFEDGEELPRQALFFTTGQHPRSTFLENLGCTYDQGRRPPHLHRSARRRPVREFDRQQSSAARAYRAAAPIAIGSQEKLPSARRP